MNPLIAISALWVGIDFFPGYNYFPVTTQPGEICSFAFTPAPAAAHYQAFLVETNLAPISLQNCTVTATFSLECSPGAVLRFGGMYLWNPGPPLPPNVRLYLATVTGYDNEGLASNYWFNSAWVELSTNTGTATLTASLADSTGWTDSGAQNGRGGDFVSATGSVREIGLAIGGGSFYDIGCAMQTGNAGTVTFHLLSFTVSEPTRPLPPQNLSTQ